MNEQGTLSYLPDDTLRSLYSFKYLTHTKKEVNKVNDYLETKQITTRVYTDSLATEAQFKHLNGDNAPDVLLISTHGFYFPPPERKRDLMKEMKGREMFQMTDNPLRRTGLAFAGANITWKGGEVPEGVDDGILTAYEVSNMDLRNTELVVLSACQTGLGDIKAGEGVFGLQRAFKLAGAKTIIMSLWNVSDKATSELMSKFFQYWIQGEPRLNAFNRAVKELRNDYPYEPDKWAAFVLVE